MQSSRNTTNIPTADELYGVLNRKLKKAAIDTTQRKLASGEYVMYEGRAVPATIVAEAKAQDKADAEAFLTELRQAHGFSPLITPTNIKARKRIFTRRRSRSDARETVLSSTDRRIIATVYSSAKALVNSATDRFKLKKAK